MKSFTGEALRWEWREGVLELTLDRAPANEIGTVMLGELEQFVAAAKNFAAETSACIISSAQKSGFPPAPTCESFTTAQSPSMKRIAAPASANFSNAFTPF